MTEAATSAAERMHEFTTRSGAETIEVGAKLAALLSEKVGLTRPKP